MFLRRGASENNRPSWRVFTRRDAVLARSETETRLSCS